MFLQVAVEIGRLCSNLALGILKKKRQNGEEVDLPGELSSAVLVGQTENANRIIL